MLAVVMLFCKERYPITDYCLLILHVWVPVGKNEVFVKSVGQIPFIIFVDIDYMFLWITVI